MEYRVFTGDDKGQIKSIVCELHGNDKRETRLSSTTITTPVTSKEQVKAPIQRLRCHREPGSDFSVLAATQADGQVTSYSYTESSNDLQMHSEWKEVRMAAPDRYIGLEAVSRKGWLTCTQRGRLRLSHVFAKPSESVDAIASLPMRLNDLRLSPSSTSLAYGGNEVDLSVWDLERTFSDKPATADTTEKKRKKGKADLMYAEIWRAKQLPNDSLSLRQPVHITSLAFLRTSALPESQQPNFHIVTGNKSGAVRRFDTRTARRPVANWENLAKTGGIKGVECGRNEQYVVGGIVRPKSIMLPVVKSSFRIMVQISRLWTPEPVRFATLTKVWTPLLNLAFRGANSLPDEGLAGAISCFTPISTTFLASVSLDRMFRIHSVFAPPPQPNEQQLKKGTVLAQEFLKSTPTAVVWDGCGVEIKGAGLDAEDAEEDVWEGMQVLGDEEDSGEDENDSGREQKRSRQ
ncbi:hypothetical protein FRC10_000131 [Ceratobasidium sp. 414]|nr:hypothetical protein FRC10_000131 [Ceratobasidium sp. 414]